MGVVLGPKLESKIIAKKVTLLHSLDNIEIDLTIGAIKQNLGSKLGLMQPRNAEKDTFMKVPSSMLGNWVKNQLSTFQIQVSKILRQVRLI